MPPGETGISAAGIAGRVLVVTGAFYFGVKRLLAESQYWPGQPVVLDSWEISRWIVQALMIGLAGGTILLSLRRMFGGAKRGQAWWHRLVSSYFVALLCAAFVEFVLFPASI